MGLLDIIRFPKKFALYFSHDGTANPPTTDAVCINTIIPGAVATWSRIGAGVYQLALSPSPAFPSETTGRFSMYVTPGKEAVGPPTIMNYGRQTASAVRVRVYSDAGVLSDLVLSFCYLKIKIHL